MANETDHPAAQAAAKMFNTVVDNEVMKKLGLNIDLGRLGVKLSDTVASNTVPNVTSPSTTREV